jgi:cell division septum initiation protein DivIVA
MELPTKENPIIEEQIVKDGKIEIVEKEYTEKVNTYEKGQVENYLNEAKRRRDESQNEVDKWENMLKMFG